MEESYISKPLAIKVIATPVFTLTGVKCRYALLDMAYGEWLVYRDNHPQYYINLFDAEYEGIRDKVGNNAERYIKERLKNSNERLSLKPNIVGLKVGKEQQTSITVERLPIHLIE